MVETPHTTVQGWLTGRHRPTPALRPQFEALMRKLGVDAEIPGDWWEMDVALSHMRDGGSPYVGLRPFTVDDSSIYFGREREATRLAEHIRRIADPNGLVVVLGASGSGKSSLLAAGLVAGQCGAEGVLAGWSATVVTWANVDELPPDPPRLVVIDQFEEVLRLPDAEVGPAVGRVSALAGRTSVVLGVRSDAFARLSEFPEFAEALQQPLLVSPMTDAELRDAIVRPAESRGIQVDPGLVEVILRDAASRSGHSLAVLPLVSNALLLTWGVATSNVLTVEDYQRSGGISSAIEELSEGVYAQLDPEEQSLARTLFLNLIVLSGEQVNRKPLSLGGNSGDLDAVVKKFVDARILTATESGVQISHEALFVHWPRLASWIDESRADLTTSEHLRRAAQLWEDSGRDDDTLLPVERLPLFDSFLSAPGRRELLGPVETEFLEASRRHFDSVLDAERRNSARLWRRGRIAVVSAVVALVLALVAGTALGNSVIVSRQAQSRQIALQSSAFSKRDANMQAQFALASYRVADTLEARSALIETSGTPTHTRWSGDGGAYLAVNPSQELVARVDGLGRATLWRATDVESGPGETFVVDDKARMLFTVGLADLGPRRVMAVGGAGGARSLWDVTDEPFLIQDLSSSGTTCYSAVFSPDGGTLALGLHDESIEIWSLSDPDSPRLVERVQHDASVSSLAFHPDQPLLYVGGADDEVAVYTLDGQSATRRSTVSWGDAEHVRVQSLAVSPDGRWLAAGLAGHRVVLWALSGGDARLAPALPEMRGWVNSVSFSPDSATLVVGDSGQNVSLIDPESGVEREVLSAPTLITGAFLAGGRVVASGIDGSLRSWVLGVHSLLRGGGSLFQLATDAEGERWLAANPSGSGEVHLWDIAAGFAPVPVPKPDASVVKSVGVTMSGDGSVLVSGTRDGGVITWDLSDSGVSEPSVWRALDEGNMAEMGVSADGPVIAAAQYAGEHTAVLQRQPDGAYKQVAVLNTPTPQMASFSPDGKLLQVGLGSNVVQLWDVANPANPSLVGEIRVDGVPGASAFSPDRRRVAVGTYSDLVTVWNVTDPSAPVLEHTLHESQVEIDFVTFNREGTRLAAGNDGGMIYGWDLAGGKPQTFVAIDSQLDRAYAGRFILGGKKFAGAGANGVLRIWDVDPESVVDTVCSVRGEPLTDEEWTRFLPGVRQRELCP